MSMLEQLVYEGGASLDDKAAKQLGGVLLRGMRLLRDPDECESEFPRRCAQQLLSLRCPHTPPDKPGVRHRGRRRGNVGAKAVCQAALRPSFEELVISVVAEPPVSDAVLLSEP